MRITAEFLEAKHTALGPAWRFTLAKELVSANFRIAGHQHSALRNLIAYLAALDKPGGEEAAAAAFPSIAAALVIASNTALVTQLKIMVLGRLDLSEICGRTKLEAEAVATWKSLFFDVENCFAATSWMVQHILAPEREAGRLELAGKLNLALRGGPDAARLALSVDEGLPVAKAARLEREELQLALKRDQALKMAFTTTEEALRWLKLDLEHQRKEQCLALERQKFEFRCAEVLRRQKEREKRAAEKAEYDSLKARQKTEQRDQLRQERELRAANSPLAQLTWAKPAPQAASQELPATLRLVNPTDYADQVAAATNVPQAGALPANPPSHFQVAACVSA